MAQRFQHFKAPALPPHGRERDARYVKEQRLVASSEHAARSHSHRADGVAMVAPIHDDDAMTRLTAVSPVPQRHFERNLDARRTAVGKKHVLKTLWRQGDEFGGELLRGRMRVLGEDDLVEQLGLRLDRSDDFRVPVAVGNHPPGRDGIDDAVPARRGQVRALGSDDLRQ